jgi:glycosyltransferase involved in cell wall biosynthesis
MSNIVIIPTFKEKENIEAIIKAISSLNTPFDVLIIDDNSPDGTAGIVKEMQKSFRNLHLIERPGKLGLGTAILKASNGLFKIIMTLSLKWMLISHMIRAICQGCTRPAKMKEQIWQ